MNQPGLLFADRMDGASLGGRGLHQRAASAGPSVLPPSVRPLPYANEAALRKMPSAALPSAIARKRSTTQVVYFISEQNKSAPEYKEQKRRLISALTASRSPTQMSVDPAEAPAPIQFPSDAVLLDSSSSSCSDDGSSNSDTTCTTVTSSDRGGPGWSEKHHHASSKKHHQRESRKRKELMKALAQPVDDLCAVADVRIDDRALLAAPAPARNPKSPRLSPRVKDAGKRIFAFPAVEPYEGGTSEVTRLGQLFSPGQALDTTLDTVKHFIGSLSLDLVSELHSELGAHLQSQLSKIVAAVDVARAICANQIVPQMESQRESLRSVTQLHSAEKYQAALLHSKVVSLQATMRGYGIVPTVHGVHAPDPTSVVIVLCDIPQAPKLWADDPELGQSAMDLFAEAARSLLKDHQGYEVAFGGWSLQLAFADMVDSVNYCLSLQAKLLGVSWPKRLLNMEAFAPDNKLCWCGLAPRMSLARGHATTVVDPESQVTKYYGGPLLMASHLLRYSATGTLVTTERFLADGIKIPYSKLATAGGAAALTLHRPEEILRKSHVLVRLVPHALRARLQQQSDNSLATGKYFLGITHRPSDLCVEKTYSSVFHTKSTNIALIPNYHIPIDDLLPGVLDDLGRDINFLREGLDTSLTSLVPGQLQTLTASGKPIIVLVAKLAKMSVLAERHPEKLVRASKIFASIVRQLLKKTQRSFEISLNFDVVTLLFASRQEAIAFAVKLHGAISMADWEDTTDAWRDAHSKAAQSRNSESAASSNDDDDDEVENSDRQAPQCRIGIDLTMILQSDLKQTFAKACRLAAAAAAGATLVSCYFKDSAEPILATIPGSGFVDQGPLSVGLSNTSEPVFSLRYTPNGPMAQLPAHRVIPLSSVAWPDSSVFALAAARLEWSKTAAEDLTRAIANIRQDSEKASVGTAVCPMSKEAVFVSLEANVTVEMWFSDHKCVLLEALRILQKVIRVLLIDVGDGYELFSDQQASMLCFHKAINAVRFTLDLQERLATTYWGPGFHDAFPQCKKVLSSEGSIMWNGLRVRCSVVSQREGITLPVVCDTIRSTGRTVFFGRPVFLSAKLCSLTCFGQILIDEITRDNVKASLKSELRDPICEHSGSAIFAGRLQGETKVFSLLPRGLEKRPRFPSIAPGSDTFSAWLNVKLKEDVVFGHHVVPDGLLAQTLLQQIEDEVAKKAKSTAPSVVGSPKPNPPQEALPMLDPLDCDDSGGQRLAMVDEDEAVFNRRSSMASEGGFDLFGSLVNILDTTRSAVFSLEREGSLAPVIEPPSLADTPRSNAVDPVDSARVTRQNSASSVAMSRQNSGIKRNSFTATCASKNSTTKHHSRSHAPSNAPSMAASPIATPRADPSLTAVSNPWKQLVRLHAVVRRVLEAEKRFLRESILRERATDGSPAMTDTQVCLIFTNICREEQINFPVTKSKLQESGVDEATTAKSLLLMAKSAAEETSFEREGKVPDVLRSLIGHLAVFHISSAQLFRSPGFRKLVSGASGAVVTARLSPRMVQSDEDDDAES